MHLNARDFVRFANIQRKKKRIITLPKKKKRKNSTHLIDFFVFIFDHANREKY